MDIDEAYGKRTQDGPASRTARTVSDLEYNTETYVVFGPEQRSARSCPWCGDSPLLQQGKDMYYRINHYCDGLGGYINTKWRPTAKQALALWNNRADDPEQKIKEE